MNPVNFGQACVLMCLALATASCNQTGAVPSPGITVPAPVGGPPAGTYSCLMLSLGFGTPTYVVSALGQFVLGPGNAYKPLSYPQGGTYSVKAGRSTVTFSGGSFNGANAVFEKLQDGTPIIRFGEGLRDPAPDVEIGESVCQHAGG